MNPEEFIKKAAALIVSEKATMIVEHISYHEIDDAYDEAIFTERMPDNASKAYEAKKNIQRFVFPDSDGERRFAEDMDAAAEVAVYAKLPRTFQIPTPVGNYAPDWAIAFKEGSVRHVFFVAETKGTMDTLELSGVENAKIACAKKLFNEMSTDDVRYHNVATYDGSARGDREDRLEALCGDGCMISAAKRGAINGRVLCMGECDKDGASWQHTVSLWGEDAGELPFSQRSN